MVQSGFYDGACDYFNAKYNLWQMDPSKLKDRMSWKGYRWPYDVFKKQDLETANDDIRAFIKESLPKLGNQQSITVITIVINNLFKDLNSRSFSIVLIR
jgi:hypothetical protein